MIQVYAIYEHSRQRNPKNEVRNYKYYVDIVSRPYRSFEIPFRRMQFRSIRWLLRYPSPPDDGLPHYKRILSSFFFLFFF